MKLIIIVFAIFIILAGISLLIDSNILIDWIETNMEKSSLYIFAIAVRMFFGIIFLSVAKASRFPVVIKVLGYLFILAAIIFLVIGQESFIQFIGSVIPGVKPYARMVSVFVIAFGGYLVYAVSGNNNLKKN